MGFAPENKKNEKKSPEALATGQASGFATPYQAQISAFKGSALGPPDNAVTDDLTVRNNKPDATLNPALPTFHALLNKYQISFLADSGAEGEAFVTARTAARLNLKVRNDGPELLIQHSNRQQECTNRWVANMHFKLGDGWLSQVMRESRAFRG